MSPAVCLWLSVVACAAAEVDFNDPNAGAPVYDDDVWAPGIGVEATPENYGSVVLDEKVDVLLYVFTPGFVLRCLTRHADLHSHITTWCDQGASIVLTLRRT